MSSLVYLTQYDIAGIAQRHPGLTRLELLEVKLFMSTCSGTLPNLIEREFAKLGTGAIRGAIQAEIARMRSVQGN